MDELYMAGYEWADRYGLRIADPIGWRETHELLRDSEEPYVFRYASLLDNINEWEFWHRLSVSSAHAMTRKAYKRMQETVKGDMRKVPQPRSDALLGRLTALVEQWEKKLGGYPVEGDEDEARYAYALALKRCVAELREALQT